MRVPRSKKKTTPWENNNQPTFRYRSASQSATKSRGLPQPVNSPAPPLHYFLHILTHIFQPLRLLKLPRQLHILHLLHLLHLLNLLH
jgi:hypothetical protein